MRLWVTRSQPGADRQAEALREAGYDVLMAPVLAVEPTAAPIPQGSFRVVAFLSEQAVRYSADTGFCADASVFAVGSTTAAALAARGIAASIPEQASSEGLLEVLSGLQMNGERVLLVAGVNGRKLLRDALLARGTRVEEYLNYRRIPRAVEPELLKEVDAILISSQDGFKAVARLWFHSGGDASISVITASRRIAGLAAQLGFRNVTVAAGAATQDWITALQDMRS